MTQNKKLTQTQKQGNDLIKIDINLSIETWQLD